VSYGTSVTVHGPFDTVVAAVRAGLAAQGFGVLTEIDVQATMKAKLDADLEPYLILGACNPALALRALGVDPSLGLLLPCNVVVRRSAEDAEATVVEAIDPMTMVAMSGDPALESVATEAGSRLQAALAAVPAICGLGAPIT
jgi:uncharacterized protein (DUF302 family)